MNHPLSHRVPALVLLACCVLPALAQRGDHAGEPQPDLPESLVIPEAPALSPAQALETFDLAEPGFSISLAAAEPMVVAPVSAVFDEDGRLWVVEMQSYMPNIDGDDELVPTSRIVILEDTTNDGVFDNATTFLDNLILPRSVLPCYGGALVLAPPNLLFAKDTDGDGKADETRVLLDGFGGLDNPEHAGNGLLYGLDNWIHFSQHNIEIRFDGETIQTRPTPRHGQWGITQDDQGRLYYCPNSDVLRMDLFPKHYASRNPNQRGVRGMNHRVMADTSVFPSRMNPGINRGYQDHMLRDDYTLARTTSACSPLIYRATAFGPDFSGNNFTCEPAGNCLMYVILDEDDGIPTAHRAYPETEFLTSTDERFRPVALATGPDGSLFVVDMYRGVIQHKTYVTTFLRKQVESRKLELPIHLGRIWRISKNNTPPSMPSPLPLRRRSNAELVELLAHPDAFSREHAQKLLVERRATDVTSQIRALAHNRDATPTARVHALWTLEGVGSLERQDAETAATDANTIVSTQGIRLLEPWADDPATLTILTTLASLIDPDDGTSRQRRLQVALSLGASRLPEATRTLADLLIESPQDALLRSAILSSLHAREVIALAEIANDHRVQGIGEPYRVAIAELADTSLRGSPAQRTRYLDLIAETLHTSRPFARILLDRLAARLKLDADKPITLALAAEPTAWAAALDAGMWDLHAQAAAINTQLRWPGNLQSNTQLAPLLGDDRKRYTLGRKLFDTCAACHGYDGMGLQGQAPPLSGSPLATGPESRAVRVLLQGMQGPITREGIDYDLQMPPAPFAEDNEIAALLTYIRRAFSNTAGPVTPDTVARIRAETADRATPWTEPELLEIAE